VTNQIAHFTVAAIVVFLAALPYSGAIIGLCLGLLREYTQMQETGDRHFGPNRAVDVSFWVLGGLAASLLVE
jgi:type III secretory pathway component EscS